MSNGETIFLIIWLLFFITTVTIVFSISRSFSKKELAVWKSLAQNTKLTLTPESLLNRAQVTGNYRNHDVQLTTFKRRPVHLVISIRVNNYKVINFTVEQQGFISTMVKSKETQVKINDNNFERLFFIEGYPKDLIKNIFLSERIKQRLMKVTWRGRVKIKFEGKELRFEQPYPAMYEDLSDYLQHLLDLLIEIAEEVESQGAAKRDFVAV